MQNSHSTPKTALVALLFATCCTIAIAQQNPSPSNAGRLSEPSSAALYPQAMYPGGIIPDWDRGYIIHHEIERNYDPHTPMVTVYDWTGDRIRDVRVWPQGAASVGIRTTAATRDGAILAAGGATMQDGSIQRYIVKTDLAGNTVQTLLTGPFGTEHMCEAQDGTIWNLGRNVRQENGQENNTNVLRNYSFEKGLLHSYLPQVTVEAVVPPRSKVPWFEPSGSYVRCGKEKVSVYLDFTDEYIQVDTSLQLNRWKLDMAAMPGEKANGLAITEDGRVYASFGPSWMGGNSRGLYQIIADAGNPVARLLPVAGTIKVPERGKEPPRGTIFKLWGADGNQLVLWQADNLDASWVEVIPSQSTD